MRGNCAGSYTFHCTITLESDWKEKFFLALCSRRNLSTESLYNRHEVTRPAASPTSILQRNTNVFRGVILTFDCSSTEKGFLQGNEATRPTSRALSKFSKVFRTQKKEKLANLFNIRSQRPCLHRGAQLAAAQGRQRQGASLELGQGSPPQGADSGGAGIR